MYYQSSVIILEVTTIAWQQLDSERHPDCNDDEDKLSPKTDVSTVSNVKLFFATGDDMLLVCVLKIRQTRSSRYSNKTMTSRRRRRRRRLCVYIPLSW